MVELEGKQAVGLQTHDAPTELHAGMDRKSPGNQGQERKDPREPHRICGVCMAQKAPLGVVLPSRFFLQRVRV